MSDYIGPDGTERVVLKWPLTAPEQLIPMNWGRVVKVAWQKGNPTLWIEHLIDAPKTSRYFIVRRTGETFAEGRYIGSVVSDDLVFHVYEREGP